MRGLEKIGVEVKVNNPGDLTGCIHDFPGIRSLSANTLLGPNIFNRPRDRADLMAKFHNLLVPSKWIETMYRRDIGGSKRVVVWPVGIDVESFSVKKDSDVDCLLYVKNRSEDEVLSVCTMLADERQSHIKLCYGQYDEAQHLDALRRCRYCILLTNTESQGIGYMETLSTGTPCFVLDMDHYLDNPATSVPYFEDRCGYMSALKNDGSHKHDFNVFLSSLGQYDPRSYILEHHTLEAAAKVYVELLRESV